MERCSFFNAELVEEEYDRVYLAEDYARYFASFIGNGVFPNPSTGLQVTADSASLNVILKPGKAWINGYFYENTDDLTLKVDVADGMLNRIDKVVLRLDFINREIKAYIKKGDFASSPVAPVIQRDTDIYEIALADIKINKGATSISQSSITDLRHNTELCGIVHGVVDQLDTTELFKGFEDGFNKWFENIKDKLSTDQLGKLQLQIEELQNSKANKTTTNAMQLEIDSKTDKSTTDTMQLEIDRLNSDKTDKSTTDAMQLEINKLSTNKADTDKVVLKSDKNVANGVAGLDDKGKLSYKQLYKGIDNLYSKAGSAKVTLSNLDIKKYSYIEIFIRCYTGSYGSAPYVKVNDADISMSGESYMLQISCDGKIFGQNESSNNGDDYYSHMRYIKTITLLESNTITAETQSGSGYVNIKGYY